MSKNLYLGELTKDLTLTDGKNLRLTSTLTEFVSQKIENILLFFRGEWFLNFEKGIPYFENVFKKNPDINLINSIFIREIRTIEQVQEILKFEVVFDSAARIFTIEFEIKISDGTTIENSFSI